MFYCEQKEFPYFLLESVSEKDVTCTELVENAMTFKTRKQAEKTLETCGEKAYFEVKSTERIYTEVYQGSKHLHSGEFDSKADCKKFLQGNGFLPDGYKVEFIKTKFRKGLTIVNIS